MRHILIIILSIFLLSSPVIGQSGKPLGVIFPPTIMGNVSDSRQQILLNTLDDELSQYFDVSPPTNVSSGDLPVVEDVFQLQIIEEDGDTQLSLRWMSGNERKVETILCGGCKTIELNGKLEELVGKLVGKKKEELVVDKEETKNSEPIVQRTLNYTDGSKYVGGYKNGKRHGQGTYTYGKGKSEGDKHVGEYKDGKYHGQGTYTWSDGSKYVGGYKNGKHHGQGTSTFSDGTKYVGEYKDNKYHGQGTYTWSDGRQWVGEWKDGERTGQGTYTWLNGKGKLFGGKKERGVLYGGRSWKWYKSDEEGSKLKYVGEIKNGEPNGQGTSANPWGDKYVGEWKNGKYHGQGTRTWSDGSKYIGEWKNGKRHGQGILFYSDTEERGNFVGEWKYGDRWNGIRYDKYGNIEYKIVYGESYYKQ